MPIDPGSLWAPLPEAGVPDGHVKNKLIVHSTGDNGSAAAIDRYFRRGDVVAESTFVVGWGPEDPTRQLMDSTDNADANLAANKSGISIEVVGDGKAGYNAWQRAELIRLGLWAAANHPIPMQVIPDPDGAGFGWHIMFGSPGPWTGVAKVCPGKQRTAELTGDIFPTIFAGGRTAPSPVKPPPALDRPPALPAWNLPRGHYYGDLHGPAASHGGYFVGERVAIRAIQQRLIYLGCVPGVTNWRSGWADGRWEQPTTDAVARWFARYRPGQPFTTRLYADDYRVLSAA